MKIAKFRIKNYKSIKDSGDCYLDDRITILAGKNEAGKTSVIEALEDFNTDTQIKEDAKPIWDENATPEISVTIRLDRNDIAKIKEKLNLKKISKELYLDVIKRYPDTYIISADSLYKIDPSLKTTTEFKNNVTTIISRIKNKLPNFSIADNTLENTDVLLSTLQNYQLQFTPDVDEEGQDRIKDEYKALVQLTQILNDLIISKRDLTDYIKKYIIPNFILFKTFDDILPNQIGISKAPEDSLIGDLTLISNLDFDLLQPNADPRKKEMHREAVNIRISEDYKNFWSQDHSNLYVSGDSTTLYFWIKEEEYLYRPGMRSKGRQWHLAFYIRVTARSLGGKNNIILIDEPGLFLHAKAQRDILKKLDECSKRGQIIYTTHSPYLIPPKKLNRVRLITKASRSGTKIKNITARADKETLTPILTAIGEDLSIGIKVDKKNSIVIEGYSDYLYFSCFEKLLNIKDNLNFIPAVGANSSLLIGCILFGWKLEPIFILDNDRNGNQTRKRLRERLAIDEKLIIIVPEKVEGSIETLFSKEDFERFISDGSSDKGKVLLALEFNNKVERGEIKLSDFSDETKENFTTIFNKLHELTK